MKMQCRYRPEVDSDGTWKVLDVFTGMPVRVGEEPAFGFTQRAAIDLSLHLNELERARIKPEWEKPRDRG